jgi:hypothetical protein
VGLLYGRAGNGGCRPGQSNLTDLALRSPAPTDWLRIDGLLTQQNDLWVRLRNAPDGRAMRVLIPFGISHSTPDYTASVRHPWQIVPKAINTTAPGVLSSWLEVGSLLDTLESGEWLLQMQSEDPSQRSNLSYALEFGVPSTAHAGGMDTIRTFSISGCMDHGYLLDTTRGWDESILVGPLLNQSCGVMLAYDGATRYTRRIRLVEDQLFEVMERVNRTKLSLPPQAKPPSEALVFCTFCVGSDGSYVASDDHIVSDAWLAAADDFLASYGLTQEFAMLDGGMTCGGKPYKWFSGTSDAGYLKAKSSCWDGIYANASCLSEFLQSPQAARDFGKGSMFTNTTTAACVAVMDLGDEIDFVQPSTSTVQDNQLADDSKIDNSTQSNLEMEKWAKSQKLTPADLCCGHDWTNCASTDWSECLFDTRPALAATNPRRYYYSLKWAHSWALKQMVQFTAVAREYAPNAGVGANFVPYDFLDEPWKWVDSFREGALTMPWCAEHAFALQG